MSAKASQRSERRVAAVVADQPPIPWSFRVKTVLGLQSVLRVMRAAKAAFGDDVEAIIIFMAVTCASVDAAMRDRELRLNPPVGPMPLNFYRLVSRRAIAASTGFPRETVRRKIAALIERDLLVADGVRVRIRRGLLDDDPVNLRFAQTVVREFTRTGERLQRISPA